MSGCHLVTAPPSKQTWILFYCCLVLTNIMTLSPRSGICEAADGTDLAQSYLTVRFVHVLCLSTDSRFSSIHNIILDWLHPWYWVSGAWVRLVDTVLLMLEWRWLSVCNIVFCKVQLRTSLLASIISEEFFGPIPQLAIKHFLLGIDMLDQVPRLVSLLVKEVCWWWRCAIWSWILVCSPFLNELLDIIELPVSHFLGLDNDFLRWWQDVFKDLSDAYIFGHCVHGISGIDPVKVGWGDKLCWPDIEVAPIDIGVFMNFAQALINALDPNWVPVL